MKHHETAVEYIVLELVQIWNADVDPGKRNKHVQGPIYSPCGIRGCNIRISGNCDGFDHYNRSDYLKYDSTNAWDEKSSIEY